MLSNHIWVAATNSGQVALCEGGDFSTRGPAIRIHLHSGILCGAHHSGWPQKPTLEHSKSQWEPLLCKKKVLRSAAYVASGFNT